MVYTTTGSTEISLAAPADKSYLVRNVFVSAPTGTHLTLTTGRATVGYFRISGALGNHLMYPLGFSNAGPSPRNSLLGYMAERGFHRGFPVPSGYTFSGDGAATSGCYQTVIYDEYDAGDITEDMPNGPTSADQDYIIYGNTGATISTATTSEYDTVVNPSEFPAFPFGKTVPANTSITIHGVVASSFAPSENDGTNDIGTQYLRFTQDRKVLFDPNRNGVTFFQALGSQSVDQIGAGSSPIHNFSSTDVGPPLLFDPPMVMGGGTELLLHVITLIDGSGANYLVADQEVGLMLSSVRG
jgi:hypothetical protein